MKSGFRRSLLAAIALSALAAAPVHAKKLKIQTSANASHFSLAYLNANWIRRDNGRRSIDGCRGNRLGNRSNRRRHCRLHAGSRA